MLVNYNLSWRITAAVLVTALACSNKGAEKTTLGAAEGKGNGDTQLMDGVSSVHEEPNVPDGGKTDDAGSSNGKEPNASQRPGEVASEPVPVTVAPPDLDIADQAQVDRVKQHLQAAKEALKKRQREPDQAIAEARAALAVDPTNIDAVAMLAHAYHAKRFYDTAEVLLDITFKEHKKAKTAPSIYYVYGLIYQDTERPEQAIVAYEKAIELDPNYVSASINLGVHYLRNKRFAEAIKIYERVTGQLGVASAVTWNNLGTAYRGHSEDYPADSKRRNELLRQAEETYKRALSTDSKYANSYYNLGLLYLDADPFPGSDGVPLETLKRLERAKTYFDEYAAMGGDAELVGARDKEVKKLIKREIKRQKDKNKGENTNF